LVAFTEDFAQKDVGTAAKLATDLGVKDAEAKLARLSALIEKWAEIADDLESDPAKMVEAIQAEVWDKVDFETYGL